ncbi:MAG TPA: SDR family oxidoreductase [Candidatus Acidoferrum sp.]|nr:SDR family oxidoreductase [Candidatus Acidoferrum sp.]
MKTIWITGAGGLIGNYLVQSATQRAGGIGAGAKVVGLTRTMLDLTDFPAVRAEFRRQQPQFVIHCAALSQSTACQADPGLARKLNVEVTSVLAELSADISFIFLSTDLVFDGRVGNYDESASVNPLSVYAETKAAAERVVLANPIHSVVRLSLNGGTSASGSRGFNEQIRRAWEAGQTLKLFEDEFRSPTAAAVTAQAIWELAGCNQPGLYHLAGSERLSRLQIGQLLARRWPELHPRIEAASLKGYNGAPRSPDTSLNCAKVQKLLSFRLPGLTEWLEAHPDEKF